MLKQVIIMHNVIDRFATFFSPLFSQSLFFHHRVITLQFELVFQIVGFVWRKTIWYLLGPEGFINIV